MILATAGPTAGAVVLEEFDERGFVFWTSSESPKGRTLAADPRVTLVWLWEGRQARVEGRGGGRAEGRGGRVVGGRCRRTRTSGTGSRGRGSGSSPHSGRGSRSNRAK